MYSYTGCLLNNSRDSIQRVSTVSSTPLGICSLQPEKPISWSQDKLLLPILLIRLFPNNAKLERQLCQGIWAIFWSRQQINWPSLLPTVFLKSEIVYHQDEDDTKGNLPSTNYDPILSRQEPHLPTDSVPRLPGQHSPGIVSDVSFPFWTPYNYLFS